MWELQAKGYEIRSSALTTQMASQLSKVPKLLVAMLAKSTHKPMP